MTYAEESPEGKASVCQRVYRDLAKNGPSLVKTIERRQALLPGYAQGALDDIASRGRAQQLDPTDGEKVGRWIALEAKR